MILSCSWVSHVSISSKHIMWMDNLNSEVYACFLIGFSLIVDEWKTYLFTDLSEKLRLHLYQFSLIGILESFVAVQHISIDKTRLVSQPHRKEKKAVANLKSG